MGAFVELIEIRLHFGEVQDLKGKRKLVKSLKDGIRHRFGASVAETEGHDKWQRATLLCALATPVKRKPARATRAATTAETRRWRVMGGRVANAATGVKPRIATVNDRLHPSRQSGPTVHAFRRDDLPICRCIWVAAGVDSVARDVDTVA